MNKRKIVNEINYDIETGVYDKFPKLKKRLEYVSTKVTESIYIENRELSRGEIQTLIENEYLDEFEYYVHESGRFTKYSTRIS